ncbi:MAG: hypothetical protein Q9218_005145 [Villophora microphyllina]
MLSSKSVLARLAARSASKALLTSTGRPQPVTSNRPQKSALQQSSFSSSTGRSQPISNRPQKSALPYSSFPSSTGRSQPIISNRPHKSALQPSTSSTSTGRPQPISNRPYKSALQRLSSSQLPPVVQRLQARRQRLATALPHAATHSLPWPKSPSTSSVTTGRSFSPVNLIIRHPTVSSPPLSSDPLPPTPQAPRSARFFSAKAQPLPPPAFVNTSEVPLKGILKKTGRCRAATSRAVRWVAGDISTVKIVDRWIERAQDVHPDPTRYLGRIQGWTPHLDGEYELTTGNNYWSAHHAECQHHHCNKRSLHQMRSRVWSYQVTKDPYYVTELTHGESYQTFNARLGFVFRRRPATLAALPKDLGLDIPLEQCELLGGRGGGIQID